MARKLIAALSAIVLTALAFVVLPTSSDAVPNGREGNCILPDLDPEASVEWAEVAFCQAIDITKVVTGDAAGRTFPITVECEQVAKAGTATVPDLPDADLFPPFEPKTLNLADGETQRLLVARQADCKITEEPPEGCTRTSIDPDLVETRQPQGMGDSQVEPEEPPLMVHTVTVTNDCPVAEPAAEPAAAEPVAAEPTFTG